MRWKSGGEELKKGCSLYEKESNLFGVNEMGALLA